MGGRGSRSGKKSNTSQQTLSLEAQMVAYHFDKAGVEHRTVENLKKQLTVLNSMWKATKRRAEEVLARCPACMFRRSSI